MEQTRIVLGLERPALQEEVLHFLERLPRVRVVAAVGDGPGLSRALAETRPDAAVVSPEVLGAAEDLDGAALLVVAERETTAGLRAAVRTGARGFFLWPEEREGLGLEAERSAAGTSETGQPGRLLGVMAARGGAGATFLATNLAAACAARGSRTVLVDLDLHFADLTPALGIVPGEDGRTLADLLPVADEVAPEHLERVLHRHSKGFDVLLAPPDPAAAAGVEGAHVAGVLRAAARAADVTIAHLPRRLDAVSLAAVAEADAVALVVTLDVLAFRDAKRTIEFLTWRGLDGRCRLVINRAARAEVVPDDAERVFGLRPTAVLGTHRAVARAQNRGELIAGRSSRLARRLAALADELLAEEAP